MQHRLKPSPRAAWAEILSPEFFDELFVAVKYSEAAFHIRFGWESASPLAAGFKRNSVSLVSFCFA